MPISGSVGEGGINRRDDVCRVQSLLNEWRGENGRSLIAVDGVIGPQTIGAIRDFQTTVTHMVDGRVDVGGPTITQLETFIESTLYRLAVFGLVAILSEYNPRQDRLYSNVVLRNVFESMRNPVG